MRRRTAVCLMVAAAWFLSRETLACPGCNIHNYLGISVRDARNIYVGKLVLNSDRTSQAEVVRVIRGDYRPGQLIAVEFHEPEKHLGKLFVFCEGEEYGPRWKCLEIGFEQEVRLLAEHPGFLLHNPDHDISTADEHPEIRMAEATAEGNPVRSNAMAVQCLQFVSVDGVEAAKAYLRARKSPYRFCVHVLIGSALLATGMLIWKRRFRLRTLTAAVLFVGVASSAPYLILSTIEPSPVPLLQQALADVASRLQQNRPSSWDAYRHGNLLGMLQELAPGTASRYAQAQCSVFLEARDGEIEWKEMLSGPSSRAELMKDVMAHVPASRQSVTDALGRLKGTRLADASFALCRAKVLGPDELLARVEPESLETCALGIFQAGQEWAWQWARSEAKSPVESAGRYAHRADFLERIQCAQTMLNR